MKYDMTKLTSEGFKGADTHTLLDPLLKNAENNGIGIVFLDEFDKKLVPSYTSGGNDVNEEIRSQILTIIEGTEYSHEVSTFSPMGYAGVQGKTIDTSNTLFIASGSFNNLRKENAENAKTRAAGFNVDYVPVSEMEVHYRPLKREDMVKNNDAYELLGRLPLIINYHPLSEEALDKVIDKLTKAVAASIGCEIVIGDEMRTSLKQLGNGKFGCRLITATILDTVYPSFIEHLEADKTSPANAVIIVADRLGESHLECRRSSVKKSLEA